MWLCDAHERLYVWPEAGATPPAWLEAAGFDSPMGRALAGARTTRLEGVRTPEASNKPP
jgi:hypothetical protein